MKTKIIQLTAGKGPVECSWVVAQVLKQMLQTLKAANINHTVLHRVQGTENGTLQSASLQLQGKGLEAFLKDWLGTVQWIGTSTYRKFHKRKNWYIGIFEVQDPQNSNTASLNEQEVRYQAIRSSGPGGQHANKVSSAVRATHIKTGIQVLVTDSRSQHQNKKTALKRLQEKLALHQQEQLTNALQQQWQQHLQLQRGNPVRVFSGTDFKPKKQPKKYKTKRQELKQNLKQALWD